MNVPSALHRNRIFRRHKGVLNVVGVGLLLGLGVVEDVLLGLDVVLSHLLVGILHVVDVLRGVGVVVLHLVVEILFLGIDGDL